MDLAMMHKGVDYLNSRLTELYKTTTDATVNLCTVGVNKRKQQIIIRLQGNYE